MSEKKILSPTVFVFKHPKKEAHVEKVTLRGHVVTCGCGEPWFAAVEAVNGDRRTSFQPLAGQSCPTCGKFPTHDTTSALEEMEVDMPLMFGKLWLPGPSDGRAVVKEKKE